MNYWPLLGIAAVVCGFALRLNPALVVVAAGIISGLTAGLSIPNLLALLGGSFVSNRILLLFVLTLPTIGLLERAGLREHAHAWVARMHNLTLARLLIAYLGLRQLLSMLGLIDLAGHAQTVRPLLAPMAEAAAQPADQADADRVKAMAAATDNVGLFFGEDIFIAIGSILLMKGFLEQQGIVLAPFDLSVWAIPTAIAAFAIHALRLWRFGRSRG